MRYFHFQVQNFFKGLVATFKALLRQESCIEIALSVHFWVLFVIAICNFM